MPGRDITFENGRCYHIFTKTIDDFPIFKDLAVGFLFLRTLQYYMHTDYPNRFSRHRNFSNTMQNRTNRRISTLAYCLMPNHFHILAKQLRNDGIWFSISQTLNSFTRSYNNCHDRLGSIFVLPFRAKPVHTRTQMLHISRYIHLNPYTAGIVNHPIDLVSYPLSSWYKYAGHRTQQITLQIDSRVIYRNGLTKQKYYEFVLGNAEYQKRLGIKKRK